MGLYDLFLKAANAQAHAPVGGKPTFGDALQGIGHSMAMHGAGTPERIATLAGTFPGGGAPRDDIGALLANLAPTPGQQVTGPTPTPGLPPSPVMRPGQLPLSAIGRIFGSPWGQVRR